MRDESYYNRVVANGGFDIILSGYSWDRPEDLQADFLYQLFRRLNIWDAWVDWWLMSADEVEQLNIERLKIPEAKLFLQLMNLIPHSVHQVLKEHQSVVAQRRESRIQFMKRPIGSKRGKRKKVRKYSRLA